MLSIRLRADRGDTILHGIGKSMEASVGFGQGRRCVDSGARGTRADGLNEDIISTAGEAMLQ